MIKDGNAQTLFMNFDRIITYGGRPSDIDMLYIVPHWFAGSANFLILAEIKNEMGTFTDAQRHIYETLIDNYMDGQNGCIFYLTHNKRWQDGSREVDVAECAVIEYYYKHEWHKPKLLMSLNEAIPKIIEYHSSINF